MTAPLAQQASARFGPPIRVVSLCGSIKPLFSGTDDFHDNLVAVLRARDMDVRPVDLGQWGLAQVPALLRKVAAEQPDLILMQYPTDAFSAALGPHVFSALQQLAPLVVTLHEFAAANPVRRASLSVLLARCAAVITTSAPERTSLLSWYPWLKARSHVIPIGANFPARDWQPREPPFIACFGQIRPEKGLEDFVACQTALASRFPAADFAIIGSRVPKFTSYYETIAAAARHQGIRLLGEMPPDAVTDCLRTAAIALLPFPSGASLRRGSLLAAAACGVPIVTLRGVDTPDELVELLQPVGSREALVTQAAMYLSNSDARRDAHERSLALAARVSWDTIGDSYACLFAALAPRRLTP
jgi:glycosyltransferase involved in cell wall biosynthesis